MYDYDGSLSNCHFLGGSDFLLSFLSHYTKRTKISRGSTYDMYHYLIFIMFFVSLPSHYPQRSEISRGNMSALADLASAARHTRSPLHTQDREKEGLRK